MGGRVSLKSLVPSNNGTVARFILVAVSQVSPIWDPVHRRTFNVLRFHQQVYERVYAQMQQQREQALVKKVQRAG